MHEPSKQIDQFGYLELRGLDSRNLSDKKAVFGSIQPVATSAAGKKAGRTEGAIEAAHPFGSKLLVSDEEFYEVFSEIRLP